MADTPPTTDVAPDAASAPTPPKRSPGHRGAEVKDTVAEMAAKAHEISLEAGSKMAAAMKDVINAAAGITGFVLESARDLVQYMVRRGQMTQEEADKLIRAAELAQEGRPKVAPAAKAEPKVEAAEVTVPVEDDHITEKPAGKSAAKTAAPPAAKKTAKPAPEAEAEKPAAKKAAPATKTAKEPAEKPAAKKTAAKKK